MSPTERWNRFQRAAAAKAAADAEFEIARALLHFDPDELGESKYEVTISHPEIAKEADVTHRCVLEWIRTGKLKALPKPETERKYRVPVKEWIRFKRDKGIG